MADLANVLEGHHVLIAQRPTLTEEPVSENRSRFVLEPLEPGFGYTLGNSLRRTLLSSIPGAAVTSIRIDGVLHEFTTVPGVKEDVTDLILNLKELVVSSESDEPVVMYLRKQGPARSPPPTSRRRPGSRCTAPTCTWPR
jgi:DNA-directed RNA polymerase subunit alpha